MKHSLLDTWLRATTCYRHHIERRVVAENSEFILMKHGSHAEYINRMVGNDTCRSYYVLYNVNVEREDLCHGEGFIKRWEGRSTDKRILKICSETLGIEFDPNYVSPFLYEPVIEESKFLTKAKMLKSFDGFLL